MIFKTFNSGIDSSISKIGMFNKSFWAMKQDLAHGHGIGYSLFGGQGFAKSDSQAILNFNTALKNGVQPGKAWATTMSNASIAAQNQARQCLHAKGSLVDLANGLQQTTVKAKAAAIGLKTLSIAGNMLLFAGISMGISALFKGIDYLIHRTEKMQEALQNSVGEFNTVTDELKSLEDELKTTTERLAELQKLADNGTISVAEEAELEILKKTNKELARKVALKQQEQAQEARDVLKDSKKNANSKVDSKYKRNDTREGDYGVNVLADEELQLAIKSYEKIDKILSTGYLGDTKLNDAQMEAYRSKQDENVSRIEEMYALISPTIEAYEDLIDAGIKLEGEDKTRYEQLKATQDGYMAYIYAINGTREAFEGLNAEQQRNVLLNRLIKQGLSKDVAKAIVGSISNEDLSKYWDKNFSFVPPEMKDGETAEEYGKRYAEAWTKGLEEGVKNANEMTVSLSELEGASDKIKTLGSAFKELSDDGYITTKTLGEIQTATGLSGDEWAEYESKLLNVKKGSAEFSQIMADLTYKMLDQTFANKDLNSLTEQQISAILRENGVVNADAVAHDWLTKAKEALRIKTALAKASTAEAVVALATEASQAGITGNALNDLIMDMGIFNNTNLDVSQKVAALQEMGYYAHWTAQGLANIDKVKKYSFDGKDYIASYDKDGKLVGIEQEKQVEIPNVEIPKITIPNYSGATSGGKSGSDKNKPDYEDPTDAIINRINLRADELAQQEEEIQNLIEIAELEKDYKKQISSTNDLIATRKKRVDELNKANAELHQMAEDLRNSTPDWNEEEWFDSQGNATEAYNTLYKNRSKEEQEKLKDQFEKISKIKKAWVENEKLINELTIENIKSIKEISDIESEALQSRFEERNADSERWLEVEEGFDQLSIENKVAAYARMVRNNREFLKEIEQDDKLSAEERDEIWKEYYEKIVDYQLEAYDLVKKAIQQYGEEVEKGYDIRISRLSSESSLLSTHFDLINAISEEQHNLNKELAEAEIAGAKMNELEKQTLFTKEEHTTLSAKLSKIMGDANSLQSDYLADLKTATEDTIEEITNNYERQYELKMKEYEVVKAELNLIKAQQKLENVENEKSVRTWNGEEWVYEANYQDVVDAKLAVEDAKYAVVKAETEQAQQNAINAIDSTAESLETQKNLFARTMEELSGETKITGKQLTDALKNIAETDLPTFEKIVEQFGDSLSSVFGIDIDSIRSSVGVASSSGGKLSHLRYSSTIAQMRANSAKWESASQSERDKLHSTNIGLGNSIGASYDSSTGAWKDKNGNRLYANGTKGALPGWGMFDENGLGSEVILTKDGILTQFNGGEKVFSPEMAGRLWEMAQINIPKLFNVPDFSKFTTLDNSFRNSSNDTYYSVNGVNISAEEGGELKGFIDYLKKKI